MNSIDDPILNDLENLYSAVICDILDELGFHNQALPHTIRALTPAQKVYGRALTVHAAEVEEAPPEPYKLEMVAIDKLVAGEVLVADLENYCGCGFWGELMTAACTYKGVHGAIMNGCSRDIWKLKHVDFPIFGMGYHPADSKGRIDIDSVNEPISIGGVTINPGDYVIGDEDGCVVIPQAKAEEVVRLAKEKVSGENTARKDLVDGVPLSEVFQRHGIL